MQTKALDTRQLARELAGAMPPLTARDQRVAILLYRLLAEGRPVAPERLAQRAGLPAEEVRRLLEDWPGVYLDEGGDGRVELRHHRQNGLAQGHPGHRCP